jgi:hypothetical protein
MTEHNTDNIDNFLDVVMERKNIILVPFKIIICNIIILLVRFFD